MSTTMTKVNGQTAESGEEYLNEKNFRSLIEWITAETLLTRPEDPLLFMRVMLDKKIGQRFSGQSYTPEDATSYVKECYADASASADENGRIATRTDYSSSATPGGESVSFQRLDLLEKLIAASRAIAMELDPAEAARKIIDETCRILEADRATLFILDKVTNHVVLSVAEGAEGIRVPVGKGIAGTVASTGKIINIVDAYSDPRFDSHFDLESGFKTSTVLCVPVKDGQGEICGVMQAINRKKGPFTEVDEEVLGILAAQAGIALTNANIHKLAVRSREKVKSILDIVRAMHDDLGINSLMFTIAQRIQAFVDCDRVTLYMLDKAKNELWAIQGDINIRISALKGIAGAVAQSSETVNIPDAYQDERFSQDYDKKSGYRTRTILAMALCGKDREVVGVLQLINKADGPFTEEDEEILKSFLDICGPILQNSHLFKAGTGSKSKGEESEFPRNVVARLSSVSDIPEMVQIAEDEEEEEDLD